MPLNNPSAGFDSVAEFQSSALPWVTASHITLGQIDSYSFPYITSFITVRNTSTGSTSALNVGFTRNGFVYGNNFRLLPGESYAGDFRIKELFLSGSSGADTSYELIIGLTQIPTKFMPRLTGSTTGASGSFGYNGIG
jgi:hypothetical protein